MIYDPGDSDTSKQVHIYQINGRDHDALCDKCGEEIRQSLKK